MSDESPKRSNLIDVTYQRLHSILSGYVEGTSLSQIPELLQPRLEQLRNISAPFGKPSSASKKKVESGAVTLLDGVLLHVEDVDKEFVFAISSRFQIDEVQALILLRSFLYNEGLPSQPGSDENTSLVDELVEAITPFYYSERLFVLRTLIPFFRSAENRDDPIHETAADLLPKILPDGRAFSESLLSEYHRKTNETFPDELSDYPKMIARWAKQNLKEQLVMLEVLFWTMWGYVSCDGPLVVQIFETAYDTNLGSIQQNSTLILDEEGTQLQQDSAAIWILITIEVLELEKVAEPGGLEISDSPEDADIYTSSPASLQRIHDLVVSHSSSQYACVYLGWAFVLSQLTSVSSKMKEIPDSYRPFLDSLLPHLNRSSKEREPMHVVMSRTCLSPEVGLFGLILSLLTNSPLFVTSIAWRTGSTVTDPNAVAFRSVLKGLVIAIVELVPVELIPDFDGLVEVWVALFGRSESQSVASICRQFWQSDWRQGIARRAILDVARSRFPIHFKPLIRILRSLAGGGFLDTDPLSTANHATIVDDFEERDLCAKHVFYYLNSLPTFSQVVPASACTGAHALYEKLPERYGASATTTGLAFWNLRPIRLPGGSTLPAKSTGRLLSGDGGDFIVISWQHEHSGWKLVLEMLTDYVNRRRNGLNGSAQDISFGRRGGAQPVTLRIEDIGLEADPAGDASLVTDALDLIRSIIQDNSLLAEEMIESLESGDPVVAHTMTEAQPPDLVQLTTAILEEAISRPAAESWGASRTHLITSAMSVLSALLAMPKYSNRVWLYIRSTTALFGSDRQSSFASAALAAERLTGRYTMTLALLHLVQQLFQEASSSVLSVLPGNPRLQQVKEGVLLRAARFVHVEIWEEHLGWKYAQLGDRFEIGRRISAFYLDVLQLAPPTPNERPFAALNDAIADVLLFKATTSTINPLVSSVTLGASLLSVLSASRRFGDARRLIYLLESHLQLIYLILNYKERSQISNKACLLEHALCSTVTEFGSSTIGSNRPRVDPIDVLASYVKDRGVGSAVPLQAIRVLRALCASFSSSQPSPPTVVGHLSDPESTVASFVRIIQHPYDDLALRNGIWSFISVAVDKEPALANLFVTGRLSAPTKDKGKGKAVESTEGNSKELVKEQKAVCALDIARETLENWKEMWELNPQLLTSVLRFLGMVWQHGLEHRTVLDIIRRDPLFWSHLSSLAEEERGPLPDYRTESYVYLDGLRRSNLHEAVSIHAYRTAVKSHALHIISLDIALHIQMQDRSRNSEKPISYQKIEPLFKAEERLNDQLFEAAPNSYDPRLHDSFMELIKAEFPALALEQLQSQEPLSDRELGDDFAFSMSLLQNRLQSRSPDDNEIVDRAEEAEKILSSMNLNMSLSRTQSAFAESWQLLLRQIVMYVRGNTTVRPIILAIAASISSNISSEKRSGDMMSTIHGTRLSLLLALLEVAWFSEDDQKGEIQSFITLVDSLHGIILNEAQSPVQSFLGKLTIPFHRTLLQVVYFCARSCQSLFRRPKALNAEQRLTVMSMVEAALSLVIGALCIVFDSARGRLDVELDRDMELLVAVFEQCTRPGILSSSTQWIAHCQETDVIGASLNLFVRIDLVGLSDVPLLLKRRQPLYAPHILIFHMALASIPLAAERLASEGVLAAYSNNTISSAISAGMIDVSLAEVPGERSPAHRAYCSMLAVVTAVISVLGRHNHFFDAEASGFVQLYGDQISRALSWSIGDPITFPLLEEIEQTVNLFTAIAQSTPSAANANPTTDKVLRVFTSHALLLLQQLNYALTHPNHLASLFEPITADERGQLEKETRSTTQNIYQMLERAQHPILARLILRLFKLSSTTVCTLINISRAETVLTGEQQDWPVHEVLIVPHTKVVLGEPASLGTLLELGNCTLDLLRDLTNRPVNKTDTSPKTLDTKDALQVAQRNIEALALYTVTQLAMWISKSEFDAPTKDVDVEEPESSRTDLVKDRRAPRTSLSLADRLRRGMAGEMAADLQSLLNKSKPILVKSNDLLESRGVDLTRILLNFLHDRVVS